MGSGRERAGSEEHQGERGQGVQRAAWEKVLREKVKPKARGAGEPETVRLECLLCLPR